MEIRRRPPNPKVKVAHLEYAIPHEEAEPRNILEKIVWEKDREVTAARDRVPLDQLKRQVAELPSTRDFVAALRENRRPALDGHEGRKAAAIVTACYKSARTGRAAKVAGA